MCFMGYSTTLNNPKFYAFLRAFGTSYDEFLYKLDKEQKNICLREYIKDQERQLKQKKEDKKYFSS